MAKKTLFKLPFETEFRIAGLFCGEKDYRLCWLLNNQLPFQFKRSTDFWFTQPKADEALQFAVFYYEEPTLQRTFFLLANRSYQGGVLFNNPPGLDYLLLINADDLRYDYSQMLKSFRDIRQIRAAYMLDDLLGRNKEAFLYDFEMYRAHELKV